MFDPLSLTPEGAEDSPSGASLRGGHRLAAVETCERLWALRYYWYFRPARENVWRMGGSLIHTAYQYWYASMMPQPPGWYRTATIQQRINEQALDLAEPERTATKAMAYANLDGYMKRYEKDRELLEPLYIEEEFAATLAELDPMPPLEELFAMPIATEAEREYRRYMLELKALDDDVVTVRSDLVYRTRASGFIWVMDYKSHGRSRVNSKTGLLVKWREDEGEYALNWQVLMNVLILRKRLGPMVRGFVIQRTTRQAPYDYDRHVLTIPTLAYEECGRVMRELVHREYQVIRKIEAGGRPSPRFHACMGRYGACDYRYVCTAPDRSEMQRRITSTTYSQTPVSEIMSLRSRLRVVR